MKNLLVSAGLMAAALICRSPEELNKAIPELGIIITRPDSPQDAPDVKALYEHYHCRALASGAPDTGLGGHSSPMQPHEEERM